jgi:hypothetical protein
MRCERVRSWVLIADPEALRLAVAPGAAGTANDHALARIARHLERCAGCRAEISAILQGEQSLARALDAMAAPGARQRDRRGADVASQTATPSAGIRARRRLLWAAVVVLAAAGLAGVIVFPMQRGPEVPARRASPARAGLAALPSEPRSAQTPVIRLSPGQNAAVLKGENPTITIVWYF